MTRSDLRAIRDIGAVHRYHQEPGAVGLAGKVAMSLSKQPFLVADAIVHGLVFDTAAAACHRHDLELRWVQVRGDVTRAAVQRIAAKPCDIAKAAVFLASADAALNHRRVDAVALPTLHNRHGFSTEATATKIKDWIKG